MNFLSLFSFIVLAAESVISPLGDTPVVYFDKKIASNRISFGTLINQSPQVLGTTIDVQANIQTPEITPSPTFTPPIFHAPRKSSYTIAIIGDSMVDTLGPDLGELRDALKRVYPRVNFSLLNYGVGGTNIDYGITRLTNGYDYLENHIPSLVSQKPDIVVIESFGYNPYTFDEGALNKHWLALATMVDIIKQNVPHAKIVLAATIAPNWDTFGDGAPFINMSSEGKRQKTQTIRSYIESTIKFAQSQHLPLADAYTPSRDGDGNGKLIYINAGDHIHPSDEGRQLFDQTVAHAIISNHLLE